MEQICHRPRRNFRRAALPSLIMVAALGLSGCGSESGTAAAEPEPAEITTAPGTDTWNEQVIKNIFFSALPEDCSDIRTYTDSTDYNARIVCEDAGTYMWFFDDEESMRSMLPEILEFDLPLLVSENWVIASPLDLEAGQQQVGGAINRP